MKIYRYAASNENGFTMIEVIVSLVLIGIMAALAGMFFVSITRGYIFTQQNNETSLKAQVAMARMVKEIGSLGIEPCTTGLTTAAVTSAEATSIKYTYTCNGTIINHTIVKAVTLIQFDTITLVDKVNSFTLTYFDAAGGQLTPPLTATQLAAIRRVDIEIKLKGADDIESTFNDSAKIQEAYY